MKHARIEAVALAAAFALCGTLAQAAGDAAPKAKAPEAATQPAKKPAADGSARAKPAKKEKQLLVDINRAGKADLMKLTDIDEKLAESIIAGRPYRTKAELVTRKVIPGGTYEAIKRNVVAKPK